MEWLPSVRNSSQHDYNQETRERQRIKHDTFTRPSTRPSETMAPREYKTTQRHKTKLRKPFVEKMRRDRINSSIDQLNVLLTGMLSTKQTNSKLEKAEILEMAVTYLKSNSFSRAKLYTDTPEQSYADGFARCLEKTVHHLTVQNQRLTQAKPAIKSVHIPKCTTDSGAQQLWRPW